MRPLAKPLVGARVSFVRRFRNGLLDALLASTLVLVLPDVAALAQPMALPAGVSASAVMRDGSLDGQRAAIWELRSAESSDQLADSIERRWRATERWGVFRSADSGWVIVSRILPGSMETAQIRASGQGSAGYFTRWHAQDPHGPSAATLLAVLPSDLALLSQVLVTEAGRRVSTLVAQSAREPSALLLDLTRSLSQLGMTRRAVPGDAGQAAVSGKPPGASLIQFQGDARELMLTLDRRDSSTVLVFHLVEAIR